MGQGYQSAGLKRRQFASKVKWFIGVPVGALLLIGIAYVVIFSGFFSIQKIEVSGVPEDKAERILHVLRPQVVAGFMGGVLGADNYFAWSDSLAYEDVQSSRVSVEKKLWSRQVRVIVHPRERYGVWCIFSPTDESECNWVDTTGIAFESAPNPEGQLIIAIAETATTTATILGTPMIKREYFEVIKRVAESASLFQLPISTIIVNRALEEVQLFTLSGTKISFSLRFDPTIAALPALKKLIASPGLAGMRTMDFTVENRVFYTAK